MTMLDHIKADLAELGESARNLCLTLGAALFGRRNPEKHEIRWRGLSYDVAPEDVRRERLDRMRAAWEAWKDKQP